MYLQQPLPGTLSWQGSAVFNTIRTNLEIYDNPAVWVLSPFGTISVETLLFRSSCMMHVAQPSEKDDPGLDALTWVRIGQGYWIGKGSVRTDFESDQWWHRRHGGGTYN